MYKIRSASGTETVYNSLEEFSAAVRRGDIAAEDTIFHTRAGRWLDVKSHPHYRLALSFGGGASAGAPVGAPATPAPGSPATPTGPSSSGSAASGQTTVGPQLQSSPTAAPPARRERPKKTRELTFIDLGTPERKPTTQRNATIIPAQRAPAEPALQPKPKPEPKPPVASTGDFLVMDGGIESPVRNSTGVKLTPDTTSVRSPESPVDQASKVEPQVEPKPEPKAELKPEPMAAAKPEPEIVAKPEPKLVAKPEPKLVAKPEPKLVAKPEPNGAPKPEANTPGDFLVMDGGLESPLRSSAGVKIIRDEVDLLVGSAASEVKDDPPKTVTPSQPLPAALPEPVIPEAIAPPPGLAPVASPVEPEKVEPEKVGPPEPVPAKTTIRSAFWPEPKPPIIEPPKAIMPEAKEPPPPVPVTPKVEPKSEQKTGLKVEDKVSEPKTVAGFIASVLPEPVKPLEIAVPTPAAPLVEHRPEPFAPAAPKPEAEKKPEPVAEKHPEPPPAPKPAPAPVRSNIEPAAPPAAPAMTRRSERRARRAAARLETAAAGQGSRLPLAAAGVAAVVVAGALFAWSPWKDSRAEGPAPAGPALSIMEAAQPDTQAVPATAPSFGATGIAVPTPRTERSAARADSAPASTNEIVAAKRPRFQANVDLSATQIDLADAAGGTTAAATAPSVLAERLVAAERAAQQELASRLTEAGFTDVLALSRLRKAQGVGAAQAAWSAGSDAIRQYRARIARIENAYQDTLMVSQRAERWPASEMRAWAAKASLAESGETSQLGDLMMSQVSEALELLAATQGQYDIRGETISFRSPATATRYMGIRTWVEQRRTVWAAVPESARPHTVAMLLRALGDGLPAIR